MTPEKFSVYFMLISVVVFSIEWIVSAIRRTVKRKKYCVKTMKYWRH